MSPTKVQRYSGFLRCRVRLRRFFDWTLQDTFLPHGRLLKVDCEPSRAEAQACQGQTREEGTCEGSHLRFWQLGVSHFWWGPSTFRCRWRSLRRLALVGLPLAMPRVTSIQPAQVVPTRFGFATSTREGPATTFV